MPSNPTTKSQVQAYRFMLRRVESALVRKDAVMLHEPMRHHLRASAVGLMLGVLGLAAFFVIGLFNSADRVEVGDIVAIEGTLQVFLVAEGQAEGERRVIPVTSLTYARLLFAALNPNAREAPETKSVDASALAGIAQAPKVGLDGAPTYLPDRKDLVGGDWSVCDTADVAEGGSNAAPRPPLFTTVIGGVPEPGEPLGQDQALLVKEESSQTTYLVWNGHRWEIDLTNPAVSLGYQLRDPVPRPISAGLLNAIPEGNSLNPPDIPGARLPSAFPQLRGVQVGEVIRLPRGAGQESFFLVRREGLQEVTPAVADLMRFVNGRTAEFREVPAADIAAVAQASNNDFDHFPPQAPSVLTTTEAPIACLVWRGTDQPPVITFSTDDTGLLGEGRRPVSVTNAVRGTQADRVFLEPTKAALVRGVVPGQDPNLGPIWLVIDQQRYRVPSIEIARVLRLGDPPTPAPAPDSILKLLRQGLTLDPQDALEQYDPELAQQRQAGR